MNLSSFLVQNKCKNYKSQWWALPRPSENPCGKHSSNKGPKTIFSPRGCWLISVTLLPHFYSLFSPVRNSIKINLNRKQSVRFNGQRPAVELSVEFEYGLVKSCVRRCIRQKSYTSRPWICISELATRNSGKNSRTRTLGQSNNRWRKREFSGRQIDFIAVPNASDANKTIWRFVPRPLFPDFPSPGTLCIFTVGKNNDPKSDEGSQVTGKNIIWIANGILKCGLGIFDVIALCNGGLKDVGKN